MLRGAPQPIQGTVVQGSPVGRPGAGAVGAFGAAGAVGAAVGAVGSGAAGGFMNTAAPTGASWANFCQGHEVVVDPSTGMISGPWGECLAWAVAYEKQNPGWHQDPRLQHQHVSKSVFPMPDASTCELSLRSHTVHCTTTYIIHPQLYIYIHIHYYTHV